MYKNKKGTTGEIELGVHVLSLLNSDGNLGSYLYAAKLKYRVGHEKVARVRRLD